MLIKNWHPHKLEPTSLENTVNNSITFGQWLRRSRLQRGLDLSSLATASNVDRSTINRLEREVAQPTVCTAVRLCNALQVRPPDLTLALQGRQVRPSPEFLEQRVEVLTPLDILSFVDTLSHDPQRSQDMLTEWLDLLSALFTNASQQKQTPPNKPASLKSVQLSRSFVDLLLSDVDFLRPELEFPPLADGKYVFGLYERGGAITLRDVGVYIRWKRQEQGKSLTELGRPGDISPSALSRIETGSLEQIRLGDILAIDQELNADGVIIWMCWSACSAFPHVTRQGGSSAFSGDTGAVWSEREHRLALTLLAIVRWWDYLEPGNSELIAKIHKDLEKSI